MANEEKRIKDDEESLLICSHEAIQPLRDSGYDGNLLIATWVDGMSCVIVRKEDWEKLIDNGEFWEPKEE